MDEMEKNLAERTKRINHMIWCVENQMEKVWDYREELAGYLRECLRLMAEQEWVKVEERLPEPKTFVLVWREDRQSSLMACWDDLLNGFADEYGLIWWKVKYWHPLPTGPGREIVLPEGEKE